VQLTGSLSTELGKAENITCTATGNSQCNIVPILPAFPIVSSLFISQSDIKAGTSVRYRVQVLSDPFLNKTVNIVGILRVFGNVTDLDASNDAAELLLRPNRHANFVVTKNTVPKIPLGDAFTYTITVRNTGPSFVFGTVVDPLPSYLTEPSWSCRGFSGAVCGIFPSDARTLIDSTFYLPLGGTLEYYLVTVLDGFFTVVNRVNVSSPDGSFASATSIVPSYIPSTTSTPTPTPTRTSSSSNDPDFVCHDPESCDDAWNEDIEKTTCTDLEDSACQDKVAECIQGKGGCDSDYSYVVLVGKEEDQTYPVATKGGASVGTVRLKKGVLKKGYTITIAYNPRMTNKDLDKGLGKRSISPSCSA
jgi:uncharacterized repeat protein (TIGR01451 family)